MYACQSAPLRLSQLDFPGPANFSFRGDSWTTWALRSTRDLEDDRRCAEAPLPIDLLPRTPAGAPPLPSVVSGESDTRARASVRRSRDVRQPEVQGRRGLPCHSTGSFIRCLRRLSYVGCSSSLVLAQRDSARLACSTHSRVVRAVVELTLRRLKRGDGSI